MPLIVKQRILNYIFLPLTTIFNDTNLPQNFHLHFQTLMPTPKFLFI